MQNSAYLFCTKKIDHVTLFVMVRSHVSDMVLLAALFLKTTEQSLVSGIIQILTLSNIVNDTL